MHGARVTSLFTKDSTADDVPSRVDLTRGPIGHRADSNLGLETARAWGPLVLTPLSASAIARLAKMLLKASRSWQEPQAAHWAGRERRRLGPAGGATTVDWLMPDGFAKSSVRDVTAC